MCLYNRHSDGNSLAPALRLRLRMTKSVTTVRFTLSFRESAVRTAKNLSIPAVLCCPIYDKYIQLFFRSFHCAIILSHSCIFFKNVLR